MITYAKKAAYYFLLLVSSITTIVHGKINLQQDSLWEARLPLYIEEDDCAITRQEKKDWTFFVYIAADNDLKGFAARNIKQMATVGSNRNINIIVHLDIRIAGNKKITRHYYIDKDTIIHLNANDPLTQKMDSGSPETLISFCNWGIESYPAHNYALILWNHGSGIIDPGVGKLINPSNFFRINPITNTWELDRTIGFLDFINIMNHERGCCWDDSQGHYLTNQDLDTALNKICNTSLQGGKFNIIGFDSCLMSMLEIANIVKKYANVMVASQEVEMGYGWRYDKALSLFTHSSPNYQTFAQHIVQAYQEEYSKKTPYDYTLAAIELQNIDSLENNISSIASMLREAIKIQAGSSVKNMIRASKSKLLCTHFDEQSYIDLHHFYLNLKSSLKHCDFVDAQKGNALVHSLQPLLDHGTNLIKQLVIANTVGTNLSKASGISIYFPENKIHSSYRKTLFAQTNAWFDLLTDFLS